MTQQKWYQQPAVQIYSLIALMLLFGHVSGTLEKRRWQRESEELRRELKLDYDRRCQEWQEDCRFWVKDNLAYWLKSERDFHRVPLEYRRYCNFRKVKVTAVSHGERIGGSEILFDGELVVDGQKFTFSVKVPGRRYYDLRGDGPQEKTIDDLIIVESKD
jgi:hypothetical protein